MSITFSELMQTQVILRIVNRIQTPLEIIQRLFGAVSGDSRGATEVVTGRDAGWDIYDSTRQYAAASAVDTGPHDVTQRVIGHQSAQLMRTHESILIHDSKVYNTRSLGGQYGSIVDVRGQRHIQRQISFMVERYRNQREWMYSRLLRGGFNMERNGKQFKLRDYDATRAQDIRVNYQIPAENLGRMQLGTGVDILSDWSNPNAPIIEQLYRINEAYTRIHGRPLVHILLDSISFLNVLNNTGIQNIGGEANTVFNSITRRSGQSVEGIPDAGFTVKFRALPLFEFHIYDGVLSADGEADGITIAETAKLIPTGFAAFLPEPDSTWHGLIEGTELIRRNVDMPAEEVVGFGAWATPVIDPPGQRLKFLDNYLPVLYNPRCIGFGNISA